MDTSYKEIAPMQDDRQQRIADNLGLARKVARNWAKKKGLPYEELLQIASVGLIKGIDRHDPSKGSFSTFVLKYCNGEILHYLRDKHPSIKIPRKLQERGQKLIATRTKLAAEWGRMPSRTELAKHLKLTVEEVDEATLAMSNFFEVGTTEDLQLTSKEEVSRASSDRLSSMVALIKVMEIDALGRLIESGDLPDSEVLDCQQAIDELCEFLAPGEVLTMEVIKPMAMSPVTGQEFEVLRIEGEQVVLASGETLPLYNVELNDEAIALMDESQLSAAISMEDDLVRATLGTALYRAKKAGRYLLTRKSQLSHGEWLPWLNENCSRVKERMAQIYIRIARNWDEIVKSAEDTGLDLAELSIEGAIELIRSPGSVVERPASLPPRLSNPNTFWMLAADVSVDLELEYWEPEQVNQLLQTIEALRAKALERLALSSTDSR